MPGAVSASASSGSGSIASPYCHPLWSLSGGYSRRTIETYEAGLRAEAIDTSSEESKYVFPPACDG